MSGRPGHPCAYCGKRIPEHMMVVGSHHDAWGFGAGDPCAGTMIVLETARCFAAAARQGYRPNFSIVFAAWAAGPTHINWSKPGLSAAVSRR